jgi:Flp pilus assembly protein TadG
MRTLRHRLQSDEGGAVLLIVAFTLIAMLGMLVLTFDLGHSVTTRRTLVQAADAASLAAAQACGKGLDPEAAADTLASENLAGFPAASGLSGGVTSISGVCQVGGNGSVTVRYTTSVSYFFAPIFGVNQGSVSSAAAASWTSTFVPPAIIVGNPSQNGGHGGGHGNTQTDPQPPGADCSNPNVGITPGLDPNHCGSWTVAVRLVG